MPDVDETWTRQIIETRLDAMDQALELLQRKSDREPSISQVSDAVSHLKELVKVQFDSTAQAAKKAEDGFTKELDAVKTNMNTLVNGLRSQITDLKNDQVQTAGVKKGGAEVWAVAVGGLGVVTGLVMAIFAIFHH